MEVFTKDDIRDYIMDMILNDVNDDAGALYVIGMIQVMDRLLNRDGLDITECAECRYLRACRSSLRDDNNGLIINLNPQFCSEGRPGKKWLTADEVKKLFEEKEKTDESE